MLNPTIKAALAGMDLGTLNALREAVDEQIKRCVWRSIRIGSYVSFKDSRRGITRYMRVERINPKTLSGQECDEFGVPTFMRWKVSPSLCSPYTVVARTGPRLASPLAA